MEPIYTFWNGQWIAYMPLEGMDPTITHTALQIAAAVYAKALAEGKGQLDAHREAESAAFSTAHHAEAS